jgi:hypothetical protein
MTCMVHSNYGQLLGLTYRCLFYHMYCLSCFLCYLKVIFDEINCHFGPSYLIIQNVHMNGCGKKQGLNLDWRHGVSSK